MHTHPTPSAHVCTTLPPGDLPMRDKYPDLDIPDRLTYVSECGRVRRSYTRAFNDLFGVPPGTWYPFEMRTDEAGLKWVKQDRGERYVVDDFGFLVLAGKGGAT